MIFEVWMGGKCRFFFRITSGIVIMIMNFMTSFTSFYFLTIPLETLPQMGSRM